VECVQGDELIAAPDRFEARRRHLHSLHRTFDHFLARGFLHLDSRGRHNIMVRGDGQVLAIDLAGSWWIAPNGAAYRILRPCLVRFYRKVLAKWRKLLSPTRSTRDEKARLAKLLMVLRMPHKAFRKNSKF